MEHGRCLAMENKTQKVPTKKTVKRRPRATSSESDQDNTTNITTRGGTNMTNAEATSTEKSARGHRQGGFCGEGGCHQQSQGHQRDRSGDRQPRQEHRIKRLRATGMVANEAVDITKDVVKGAIQATEEVGTGLILSTKSVAKGMVMGVSDVGGDVISYQARPSEARSRARPRSARMWPWLHVAPWTA